MLSAPDRSDYRIERGSMATHSGDLIWASERLRKADIEECLANGFEASEGLLWSARSSLEFFLCYGPSGNPAVIFGVSREGAPWLLGTDESQRMSKFILRSAPKIIEEWHQSFPILENWSYSGNTMHHRWLRSLGFTLGQPMKHRETKAEFIPFWRVSNVY